MLFPCKECSSHFTEVLKANPIPKNLTRDGATLYTCQIHNVVNVRLNKEVFPCENAAEFWGGKGDCGCSK